MWRQLPKTHIILLFVWLLINLVQAAFTELAHDECYYWLYGENAALGYFHQPPMIGVFIKTGYSIFESELGVRLISVLLNAVAMHLLFLLTSRKSPLLFWGIIFSTLLFNVGGWFAAPDSPLTFFAVLFLFVLQKYLRDDRWKYAVLLGIIAAALLYSKYHGILLIGAALLANISLLKRGTFYLIVVLGVVLFVPHVLWQFDNDFPGLGYHLSDRFGEYFYLEHILNYPLGQLLLAGPLVGFITLYAAFFCKTTDPFQRTLKVALVGIFGFFFLWSFKGQIESNWTATAFIPLLLLATKALEDKDQLRKWFVYLAIPSIALVFVGRVHLITPLLPPENALIKTAEFHGWDEFSEQLNERTGGKPLAANSYRIASKLSFYNKTIVPSLNITGSGNDFNLWSLERDYIGQDLVFLYKYGQYSYDSILDPEGNWNFLFDMPDFRPYREVSIIPETRNLEFKVGQRDSISVTIDNPYPFELSSADGDPHQLIFSYHLLRMDTMYAFITPRTMLYENVLPKSEGTQSMTFQAPREEGDFLVQFVVLHPNFPPWILDDYMRLTVRE
jgi:hypothetical protein